MLPYKFTKEVELTGGQSKINEANRTIKNKQYSLQNDELKVITLSQSI